MARKAMALHFGQMRMDVPRKVKPVRWPGGPKTGKGMVGESARRDDPGGISVRDVRADAGVYLKMKNGVKRDFGVLPQALAREPISLSRSALQPSLRGTADALWSFAAGRNRVVPVAALELAPRRSNARGALQSVLFSRSSKRSR
jgi:hypothetical protein